MNILVDCDDVHLIRLALRRWKNDTQNPILAKALQDLLDKLPLCGGKP